MGPTSSRSRRRRRMISWPAANGMSGSNAVPIATVEPSGTKRSMASAIVVSLLVLPAYGLDVSAVVALELFHRVATELLEERVGQRQRHHRLADHARGRHHAHIAPLVVRLDLFLGLEVDRLHRLLHRRDRLDGDAQVDGLAIGDSAREAARAVGEVA